jgi:hypothetical protein
MGLSGGISTGGRSSYFSGDGRLGDDGCGWIGDENVEMSLDTITGAKGAKSGGSSSLDGIGIKGGFTIGPAGLFGGPFWGLKGLGGGGGPCLRSDSMDAFEGLSIHNVFRGNNTDKSRIKQVGYLMFLLILKIQVGVIELR